MRILRNCVSFSGSVVGIDFEYRVDVSSLLGYLVSTPPMLASFRAASCDYQLLFVYGRVPGRRSCRI